VYNPVSCGQFTFQRKHIEVVRIQQFRWCSDTERFVFDFSCLIGIADVVVHVHSHLASPENTNAVSRCASRGAPTLVARVSVCMCVQESLVVLTQGGKPLEKRNSLPRVRAPPTFQHIHASDPTQKDVRVRVCVRVCVRVVVGHSRFPHDSYIGVGQGCAGVAPDIDCANRLSSQWDGTIEAYGREHP
jgi:hypothetical protein